MEALEPNMYVRLNCNYELGIGKTIGEIDEDNFIKTKFKDDFECSLPTYMIKKASYNIIDLIQVGDYVNGERVIALKNDISERNIHINSKGNSIFVDYDLANNWYYGIDDKDIKSVVTKEMFESMKYEVK